MLLLFDDNNVSGEFWLDLVRILNIPRSFGSRIDDVLGSRNSESSHNPS